MVLSIGGLRTSRPGGGTMGVRQRVTAAAAALAACGIAGAAQAPRLAALTAIAPGQWQLTDISGGTRTLCVPDPRMLLQIEHGAAQCSRFVIADDRRSATVHYTCPGSGHGRTTISVVDAGQFRLQTQGMHDGAPFDSDYEARRIGGCGGETR